MSQEQNGDDKLMSDCNAKLLTEQIVLVSYLRHILEKVQKKMVENPDCNDELSHVNFALKKIDTFVVKLNSGYMEAIRQSLNQYNRH